MPDAWALPVPFGGSFPNLGINRVYTCLVDNGAQSFTGIGGNLEIVHDGNLGWDIGTISASVLGGPTAPAAAEGAHGTAVAGIMAADWETTSGLVGIAPFSSIFSLALGAPAIVSEMTLALDAARTTTLPNADPTGTADRDRRHRRVILLSVPHNALAVNSALSSAIANALAAEIPVIVPTGDQDTNSVAYPASDPGVIAVGAVYHQGTRVNSEAPGHGTNTNVGSWGSNFSSTQPFVSAPGFVIPSTDLNGASGYSNTGNYVLDFQGTAAAAAHVAGLSALLLAHNPRLTAKDVRTIVYRTADKVGGTFSASDANHPDGTWNQNVGYGRINARNAVIEARRVRAEVAEVTGSDPSIVEFGTVQPGHTAEIAIRLRHTTTLCTHPITFVLPTALPAHVQWAAGTPASITLASGATQSVVLQYVGPNAAEQVSGVIAFLTDDFLARSITLSVHAQ